MMLHRPQSLQCDSRICTASRRASVRGPIPFPGNSARSSVSTAPTPRLRHFFGPNISGCTRAHARNTAIKVESSVKAIPAQYAGNDGAKFTIEHCSRRNAVNQSFPNSFLLHAGRRMDTALVAGGVSPPASSPIICVQGSNLSRGGA
jgi:hypothetical protein